MLVVLGNDPVLQLVAVQFGVVILVKILVEVAFVSLSPKNADNAEQMKDMTAA